MRLNDLLSSTGCYWYVQANSNIVPIGNESGRKNIRPDYFHLKMQ